MKLSKFGKIGILQLGNSNIYGVKKLSEYLGVETQIISDKNSLKDVSHLIIPGVGSFDFGMKALDSLKLEENVLDFAKQGNPILGICLGMQLLGQGSEEGTMKGLALYEARFESLARNSLKTPHVGFNNIRIQNSHSVFTNLDDKLFYFNHTYACTRLPESRNAVTSSYGIEFVSGIFEQNIIGVQFHPEKSYESGQILFTNFFNL